MLQFGFSDVLNCFSYSFLISGFLALIHFLYILSLRFIELLILIVIQCFLNFILRTSIIQWIYFISIIVFNRNDFFPEDQVKSFLCQSF